MYVCMGVRYGQGVFTVFTCSFGSLLLRFVQDLKICMYVCMRGISVTYFVFILYICVCRYIGGWQ